MQIPQKDLELLFYFHFTAKKTYTKWQLAEMPFRNHAPGKMMRKKSQRKSSSQESDFFLVSSKREHDF